PYSNAKLEATNKLIKDIKRQAFGFRNFTNFKTKIYIALNIKNILRLVVRKSPTGESTHYFFHSQDDKVEVSC
ncbi:transposase, partial [Streptococcus suis]